jgi:hypothetical protein
MEKIILELSPELAETLTGVLGDLLDGTGNFSGSILVDLDEIYEMLAGDLS